MKGDGSVVTWGHKDYGGDSDSVQQQLKSGVQHIYATNSAFAALKADGSVVAWGNPREGGALHVPRLWNVASQLTGGVQHIISKKQRFAAVKEDGNGERYTVAWGVGQAPCQICPHGKGREQQCKGERTRGIDAEARWNCRATGAGAAAKGRNKRLHSEVATPDPSGGSSQGAFSTPQVTAKATPALSGGSSQGALSTSTPQVIETGTPAPSGGSSQGALSTSIAQITEKATPAPSGGSSQGACSTSTPQVAEKGDERKRDLVQALTARSSLGDDECFLKGM